MLLNGAGATVVAVTRATITRNHIKRLMFVPFHRNYWVFLCCSSSRRRKKGGTLSVPQQAGLFC